MMLAVVSMSSSNWCEWSDSRKNCIIEKKSLLNVVFLLFISIHVIIFLNLSVMLSFNNVLYSC